MMKILVTGASGFVGNVLMKKLQKFFPGSQISAFAVTDDPLKSSLLQYEGLRIIEGNIINRDEVHNAVKGHTHVIHLAGLISYWKRDRKKLIEVNKIGVKNIVEACIEYNINHLVHVSSVGAVGFYKNGRLVNENTPFNWPKSFFYMVSKFEGQKIVERAVEEKGLKAVILNPASIMGPGDPNLSSPHNQLYNTIYKKTLLGCFSGGLGVVDVRDLVNIIIKALDINKYAEEYLIVGANVEYSRVVKTIAKYAQRRIYPFLIPSCLLSIVGGVLELIGSMTKRRPLITYTYGKLSSWKTYYSSEKSQRDFDHDYIPFEKTIADSCRYFEENFL
jgi:dihydroflavonol-4-reductase